MLTHLIVESVLATRSACMVTIFSRLLLFAPAKFSQSLSALAVGRRLLSNFQKSACLKVRLVSRFRSKIVRSQKFSRTVRFVRFLSRKRYCRMRNRVLRFSLQQGVI